MRPIGRLRRRDRRHRGRLHQLGRMRLTAGNTDRLQSVFFIKRIGDGGRLQRAPIRRSHRRVRSPPARDAESGSGGRACQRKRATVRGMAGRAIGERHALLATGSRGGTCFMTQPSSVATSGATPWRSRKRRRIGCRRLVDHGQARVDGGAVLGIDRPVDRRGEHDAARAACRPTKASRHAGLSGAESRAGDRDQASALRQPRQVPTRYAATPRRPCGDRHERPPRMAGSSARRSARCRRRDDRRSARRRSG